MSLIDKFINNFPPAKTQQEFRREVRGSGTVPIETGNIPANDYILESFSTHKELGPYVPLDWVRINNKSSNDILVLLDQDEGRAVPLSSGQTNTISDLGKFRTLEIRNLGTTEIVDEDLDVTVMRTPRDESDDYQEQKEFIQGY